MTITWEELRENIQLLAEERSEWAGYPMPIEGAKLVLEPRYPIQTLNGATLGMRPDQELGEECTVHNSWYSERLHAIVYIASHDDAPGFRFPVVVPQWGGTRLRYWIETLGASRAWDAKNELKAMGLLAQHIPDHAFDYYVLTGTFLETSRLSGVTYLFRKSRPTVAIRMTENGSRILAALCLHPVGYYSETWAGVMVPTDEVLAHLLLMRADERKYWAKANHHPAWSAQAGV